MTNGAEERHTTAARVGRAHEGRLLGGVCAGLPSIWGLGTNGLRLAFVVAALCGGVGVVLYLACWLVIPLADKSGADRTTGVVVLAWAACGLVMLVLLAAVGASATVFGLGWVVVALAGALLALVLSGRTRIPSAAGVVGVAALTLPAVAIALGPVRLTLQSGASVATPASASTLQRTTYRSGLGTLLIDLRHTKLPGNGTLPLRVNAGLRRTIVALPASRCVHVLVNFDVHPFAGQLASLLAGRSAPFGDVVLFGHLYTPEAPSNPHGAAVSAGLANGPTLDIDFTSQGGGLFVRDYPDDVDPDSQPNWPGFVVHPEPRPDLTGEPGAARKQIMHSWHRRRRIELANQRMINGLMPGPCAR
jgi:phage shock protein PspC (stress-responsive transcriptional regulator)